MFVTCVEAIINLLLHNLHDRTFNVFVKSFYDFRNKIRSKLRSSVKVRSSKPKLSA